jgi:hypothetical protein
MYADNGSTGPVMSDENRVRSTSQPDLVEHVGKIFPQILFHKRILANLKAFQIGSKIQLFKYILRNHLDHPHDPFPEPSGIHDIFVFDVCLIHIPGHIFRPGGQLFRQIQMGRHFGVDETRQYRHDMNGSPAEPITQTTQIET